MTEIPDPSLICQADNVGPNRVVNPLNPLEARCLFAVEVVDAKDLEGNPIEATGICNAIISFAAAEGYPDGHISRFVDRDDKENPMRCLRHPNLKRGEEYNEAKSRTDFLGGIATAVEAEDATPPDVLKDFTGPLRPIVEPREEE